MTNPYAPRNQRPDVYDNEPVPSAEEPGDVVEPVAAPSPADASEPASTPSEEVVSTSTDVELPNSAETIGLESDVQPAEDENLGLSQEVPTGTVNEVLAWVGNDKDRATVALRVEEAEGGNKRKTLISSLKDIKGE